MWKEINKIKFGGAIILYNHYSVPKSLHLLTLFWCSLFFGSKIWLFHHYTSLCIHGIFNGFPGLFSLDGFQIWNRSSSTKICCLLKDLIKAKQTVLTEPIQAGWIKNKTISQFCRYTRSADMLIDMLTDTDVLFHRCSQGYVVHIYV